ncbi:MAG: thiamine pyrophosphate-dependent enzyme [Patescibacteria group bacterium]
MSNNLKLLTDLDTGSKCNWCPGCGDFGILVALKQALFELKINPEETMIVSGIGCGSQTPHLVKVYGFHSLHGRALPVATAMKMANHKMNVIIIGGDGDGYGIGIAHLIHSSRRNYNVTYIVQNNQVYGLTKGQTSPTSDHGYVSKSTPEGVIEVPIRPLSIALSAGATFIARGYAGDIMYLKKLIMDGIQHKGFSLIDILQPCVTFNKINTYQWYQQRIHKLDSENHDPTDRMAAFKLTEEWGEKIPVGIYYKEDRWLYEDELLMLKDKALVDHSIENIDIDPIINSYL